LEQRLKYLNVKNGLVLLLTSSYFFFVALFSRDGHRKAPLFKSRKSPRKFWGVPVFSTTSYFTMTPKIKPFVDEETKLGRPATATFARVGKIDDGRPTGASVEALRAT